VSNPAICSTSSHIRVCCSAMSSRKLDLSGLKCPLPVLRTRKALKSLQPGDRLEVLCTDPLAIIDVPNLIRETGDHIEVLKQGGDGIVFLIEKHG
jgi:tRNA 2-thiouridine synthesizing protein A